MHSGHFKLPNTTIYNPYQKPLELNFRLLTMFCPPAGTVIDITAGSASMSCAAARSGRNALAFEAMFKLACAHLRSTIDGIEEEIIDFSIEAKTLVDREAWSNLNDADQSKLANAYWEASRGLHDYDPRMVPASRYESLSLGMRV
jgi:hypothetical protein